LKHIRLFIISFFISTFATKAYASDAYIGQFLYKYDGGSVYRLTVKDAKSMSWECINGSEKGANGIEKPERFKVADKIYFVSWVEKTGINVSQVIDLKQMKVYSTIIDGNERYILKGIITREK
jgi:phenolic acid decarboxylase